MLISDQEFLRKHGVDIQLNKLYTKNDFQKYLIEQFRETMFKLIEQIEKSAKHHKNQSEDEITSTIITALNCYKYF